MKLPKLTHLQFLVVTEILGGAVRGRGVRAKLNAAGVRQSGPAFYQMMATLEDAAFVSGWYEQQIVDGQIIRERHYKVLANGRKAAEESRSFYKSVGQRNLGLSHGR
jgi:hypothetical protein